MGIPRLLGICFAFLFASSVGAVTIDVGPSDYRNYGPGGSHTSGGIRSTFQQPVRMPPNISGPTRTLTVNRNPIIPYSGVANGLRSFVRVSPQSIAASAAITGMFLAFDWVWDEVEQSWGKYEFECPIGAICAIDGDQDVPQMCSRIPGALTSVGEVKTVTASQAFSLGGVSYPPGTVVSVTVVPGGGEHPGFLNNCVNKYPSGRWQSVDGAFPQLIGTIISEPDQPEETFLPPTEADWAEAEAQLPALPPGQVAQGAGDAQRRIGNPLPGYSDSTITGPSSVSGPTSTSTSTDPATGSTTVTETSTQTNLEYGDTTITTTTTTTSTTYENGQHTNTETTVEGPGELPVVQPPASGASEWPGFCEWATVVCDWLDWTQEEPPPEEDLPQPIDEDFYEEKTISFGSKACPPDHEINLGSFLSTSVSVSFQPLCDFAGLVYYMVMAASYIIAAYISIGVARNG